MKSSSAKKVKAAANLPFFLLFTALGVFFLIFNLQAENTLDTGELLICCGFILIGLTGLTVNVRRLLKKKAEPAAAPESPQVLDADRCAQAVPAYEASGDDVTFYLGWCGKMNQSYRMEDAEGHVIYEGNLTDFSLLGNSDYEFINHLTGERTLHKIGKTVTHKSGGMTLYSTFKLDGVDILEYLERQGMEFRLTSVNPLKPEFRLLQNGAVIMTCRLQLMAKRSDSEPGVKKSSNVIMTTKESLADYAFLCGMIVLKLDFSVMNM